MSAPKRRTTRQRVAVQDVLAANTDFMSAQEIHLRLRAEGDPIGLATVYRTLNVLSDDGRIDVVRGADGEALYRSCRNEDHHHHLVCRLCGYAVELILPGTERRVAAVGAEHGFTDISHTFEVFGLCVNCTAAEKP